MDVVICGAGGHGRELHSYAEDAAQDGQVINVIGFVDDSQDRPEQVFGTPVLGGSAWLDTHPDVMILLGIGNGRVRRNLADRWGWNRLANLVHPTARISRHSTYAPGFQAMPGAVVCNGTSVGLSCLLNINSVIGHDDVIGDWVTVSPMVGITANIHIEDGVTIGTGANIIPGQRIGAGAVVAAGATVVRDVPAHTTVMGTPARPVRDHLRSVS